MGVSQIAKESTEYQEMMRVLDFFIPLRKPKAQFEGRHVLDAEALSMALKTTKDEAVWMAKAELEKALQQGERLHTREVWIHFGLAGLLLSFLSVTLAPFKAGVHNQTCAILIQKYAANRAAATAGA